MTSHLMKNSLFIIIITLSLSACGGDMPSLWQQLKAPIPPALAKIPEGTELFQAGWRDGCETGMSAYGNERYKAAYTFRQNPELVRNFEYYSAWKDSYYYCLWYIYSWSRPWQQ